MSGLIAATTEDVLEELKQYYDMAVGYQLKEGFIPKTSHEKMCVRAKEAYESLQQGDRTKARTMLEQWTQKDSNVLPDQERLEQLMEKPISLMTILRAEQDEAQVLNAVRRLQLLRALS